MIYIDSLSNAYLVKHLACKQSWVFSGLLPHLLILFGRVLCHIVHGKWHTGLGCNFSHSLNRHSYLSFRPQELDIKYLLSDLVLHWFDSSQNANLFCLLLFAHWVCIWVGRITNYWMPSIIDYRQRVINIFGKSCLSQSIYNEEEEEEFQYMLSWEKWVSNKFWHILIISF